MGHGTGPRMGEGGKWVGGSWEESEEGCIGLGEAGTLALLFFFSHQRC